MINDIVAELIKEDTQLLIERLAVNIRGNTTFELTQNQEALGIILLAVDDAKTSDRPASASTLYREVFELTKEMLKS